MTHINRVTVASRQCSLSSAFHHVLLTFFASFSFFFFFFFFNDTATTEIYTLSLHDALPICLSRPHYGSRFPFPARLRTSANKTRQAASLRKGLEPRRCTRVSAAQHHPHAALLVHLSGRCPVDFIGADHTAASAGQFVADAALLVGVIAHRQNRSRFQHKDGHSRRCAGEARVGCRHVGRSVAGVRDQWHFLHHWLTGCRSNVAHRQPRRGAVGRTVIRVVPVRLIPVRLIVRMPEEMPIGAEGRRDLLYLEVIHQAQRELALAFERGARTARGQHDDLPWPEWRQQPLDDVALGMAFAIDVAILVDLVAAGPDRKSTRLNSSHL